MVIASPAMESFAPAHDELPETVRTLLPEAWRSSLLVTRDDHGTTSRFTDDQGQHTIEARRTGGEGRDAVYSYAFRGPAGDPSVALRVCREALAALGAAVDTVVDATGSPHAGFDLQAQPAAGEALAARVEAALPADWRRDVRVVLVRDGFAVGFRDEAGQ